MNNRKFWLSTVVIMSVLCGTFYMMQNCGRKDELDHRNFSTTKGEKDNATANSDLNIAGPVTRPSPATPGTFDFIGTADRDLVSGSNGKSIVIYRASGKNSYGLSLSDFGSNANDIDNNTGTSLDFYSAPALITIPNGISITDQNGQPTDLSSIRLKRLNVRAASYTLTKTINSLRDPVYLVTASSIQILPEITPGQCLWNTNIFSSVNGGCKDLQTGIIWNTQPFDFYYNQTCSHLNNAKFGGLTNWDLPSTDELKQIAGINVGLAHFNVWPYLQFPGVLESHLTPGFRNVSSSLKFPDTLKSLITDPTEFSVYKLIAQNFNAPFWTREAKMVELLSGAVLNGPTQVSCGPLRCADNLSDSSSTTPQNDQANAMCISRPGGVLPPPVIGAGPRQSGSTSKANAVAACKTDDTIFQSVETSGGCVYLPGLTAWSKANGSDVNYKDALAYCDGLKQSSFSDWVLPDEAQVASIAGNSKAGSHFAFSMADRPFWVLTNETPKNRGKTINLQTGNLSALKLNKKASVVCVRATTNTEPKAMTELPTSTGAFDPNSFKLQPPLYYFSTSLPTPKEYDLNDMAAEFANQDVIVTGKISFATGSARLLGAIQYNMLDDKYVSVQVGVDANFIVFALADGRKPRVLRDMTLRLQEPSDSSQMISVSGTPVTDLRQLDGKKVQVKLRVSRSDFERTNGVIRADRIKQVPIAPGGCSYESDRFETVAEGCQVDGGAIFWTGVNFASSTRPDNTYPYFTATEQPLVDAPIIQPGSICAPGSAGGAGAALCSGDVKTYNISILLKQLGSGFVIPEKSTWISYLNSMGGSGDHLFPLSYYFPAFRTNTRIQRHIPLRDSSSYVIQADAGDMIAMKSQKNPKVLPGSWRTVLGSFSNSELITYAYPTSSGVSMRLFESKPVRDATAKTYFYMRTDFPAAVNASSYRSVGLIARYRGPLNGSGVDSNMYAANVEYNGTFTANISRNVNGVWTKLASAPLPNPLQTSSFVFRLTGLTSTNPIPGGLLTFAVVGNQLTLKFTDQNTFLEQTIVSVMDNSLTDAGLTGIRTNLADDPYPVYSYRRVPSYSNFSLIEEN